MLSLIRTLKRHDIFWFPIYWLQEKTKAILHGQKKSVLHYLKEIVGCIKSPIRYLKKMKYLLTILLILIMPSLQAYTFMYAGQWGDWGAWDNCPTGSFAGGYAMKVEADRGGDDDTAVNGIRLDCYKRDGTSMGNITSTVGGWGTWNSSVRCTSSTFMTGSKRSFETDGGSDDTALNSIAFACEQGEIQAPGGMSWGTWNSYQYCPSGQAICGVRTRVEEEQGGGDDTAMNGAEYACCLFPAAPPIITQGTSVSVTMSEDSTPTAFSKTLSASDINGDTLTWSISSQASNGTASVSGTGTSKSISYNDLVANFNGSDSFIVEVSDGSLSDTITVNVTISSVNDSPSITEAPSLSVAMSEDNDPGSPFSLTLNASDADGDTLTWSIDTQASHGTASVAGTGTSKAISYTPTLNFIGQDSFVVKVVDPSGGSDTITVTVNVNDPNLPNNNPVASNGTFTIDEDSFLNDLLTATDADGDNLTYIKASDPSNGTVTITSSTGFFIYTPTSNYKGSDSFTFKVNDGVVDSNTATVNITITPIADKPTVTTAITDEDTQSTSGLVISRNTIDSTEVTHFKITNIQNGTLYKNDGIAEITTGTFITFAEGNAGLKFTPSPNSNLIGTFNIQAATANDGGLGGNVITATIKISTIADTPTITPATTDEDIMSDSGLVISANAVDGTEVTHFKITNITNGTLYHNNGFTSINEGDFITYVQGQAGLRFLSNPNSLVNDNFVTTGSFDIQAAISADDTGLGGNPITATITINPVADPPSVTNANAEEGGQSSSGLVISRNAVDDNEVTHFKITNITEGTLYQNDGTTAIAAGSFITFAEGNAGLKFSPASINNGTFDIQASLSDNDNGLGGNVITATINLGLTNDPPVLSTITIGDILKPYDGSPVTFTATASDPDAPAQVLTFSLAGSVPSGANINPITGQFSWIPSQSGEFTFTIVVTDNGQNPNNLSATEEITITLTNNPILDAIGDKTVPVDIPLIFTASAVHHHPLTFSLKDAPADALIDPETGTFNWTPTEDGVYKATIVVTESAGLTAEETITITVSMNTPPTLKPIDNQAILLDRVFNFTAEATDAQDNQFIYGLSEAPEGATIHPSSGQFTWTPTATGTYKITVQAIETNGEPNNLSTSKTVDIFVNTHPFLTPIKNQAVEANNTLTLTATASHPENNPLQFSLVAAPEGSHIEPKTGAFTWTPTENGVFEVTVQVIEKVGELTDAKTFFISVGLNTPPVLEPIGNHTIPVNRVFNFTVKANDEQGNTFIYSLVNGETPEGATIHPLTGKFTWIPTRPDNYKVTVKVTEADGEPTNLSTSETLMLTVNTKPVLDPIGDQTVTMGATINLTASAFHPFNDALTFSLLGAPEGATIDPETGNFSWTPDQVGLFYVTVKVTETAGELSDEETIKILVNFVKTELYLNLSNATILKNTPVEITGKLYRSQNMVGSLKDLEIQLTVIDPNFDSFTRTTKTHTDSGDYRFENLPPFDIEGEYLFQTTFSGNVALKEAESEQQILAVSQVAGYAILVQGRIADGEGMETYNKTLNRIYRRMKMQGFKDENIHYFNYNTDQEKVGVIVDGMPTKNAIQAAFSDLQKRIKDAPAPLYIVMVDHGGVDGSFYIDNGDGAKIMPFDLSGWLDYLESGLNQNALEKPRVVIIGSCYSGSFIPPLSKQGRVIVTSAAHDEESYKGPKEPDETRSGEFFMEALFSQLGKSKSLKTAFELATETTEIITRIDNDTVNNRFQDKAAQHPLLDDNSDGEGSNDLSTGDGNKAAHIFLGAGTDLKITDINAPAEILKVTQTTFLKVTESTSDLFATVNNLARVEEQKVMVDIRVPSMVLEKDGAEATEQLEINELERLFLTTVDENNRFTDLFDQFYEPGKYEVFYFVNDTLSGDMSAIKRSVVYKNKIGNRSPNAFNLLTPADDSRSETTLIFDWESTVDPDGDLMTYTLLVSTDPDFNKVVYRQEELPWSMTYLDKKTPIDDPLNDGKPGLRDGTEYFWKVEAIDNYGARSFSEVFSFTTNNTNAPPGIGSLHISSALDFSSVDNAELVFLDEFGNPLPDFDPNLFHDQGNYNMLLPHGRRRAVVRVAGFEDQEVELDTTSGFASLNIVMEPEGGIPINHGQLSFSATQSEVKESEGIVNVLVKRSDGNDGEVSISYSTTAGTASENFDYQTTQGTLTWADKDKAPKRISIPIANDAAMETDEGFTVNLWEPTGGAKLGNSLLTVTIKDDDLVSQSKRGTLQFSSESYLASEKHGELRHLKVTRTGGNEGEVSVHYTTTTDSTAISGVDYTEGNGELTWLDGDEEPKRITITLIDEGLDEQPETVRLMLFNPTGDAQLGTPFQTVLTIHDKPTPDMMSMEFDETGEMTEGETTETVKIEEEPITIQFLSDFYITHEEIGKLTTFTVTKSVVNQSRVSVQYGIIGGTAIIGQDYVGGSGWLVWEAGDNTPKPINLTLLNDEEIEGPETIELQLLRTLGPIKLGKPRYAVLGITDDETPLPQDFGQYTHEPSQEIINEINAVKFSAETYTKMEGDGKIATLMVTRTGDGEGEVSVQYIAKPDSSAFANYDYTGDSFGRLKWKDSDKEPKSITLTLLDDEESEGAETVHFMLFNVTGNVELGLAETKLIISDDDTVFLPSLGQGHVVFPTEKQDCFSQQTEIAQYFSEETGECQVNTFFRGGASVNGEDYQSTLTLSNSQGIHIVGQIDVDANHVGQKADILIVAGLLSEDFNHVKTWLMFDKKGQTLEWDGDLGSLVAARENISLLKTQSVEIHQGLSGKDHLAIFFGYYLQKSGLIVFNGEQGIQVRINQESEDSQKPLNIWPIFNGNQILTASSNGKIRFWESKTGHRLSHFNLPITNVEYATFSPDRQQIATVSNNIVYLWNVNNGRLLAEFIGHKDAVKHISFSADGRLLATTSWDNTVRLWEVETGKELLVLEHQAILEHATFSPDGKQVITTSWDKTARMWDTDTGEELAILEGHQNGVSHAAFSPDGQYVVTTSWDKTARLWKTPLIDNPESIMVFVGHQSSLNYVVFSPDGQNLVTSSSDGTVRLWETLTGNPLHILKGHKGNVWHVGFSPNGKRVISASWDNTVRIWEIETGELLTVLKD
ncbi:Calx-beta domain-containing protein [Candidatus Parabeggiatoa sp. HSG14]|uniref:Calx-beta domain-containing protein n=1 Tax=Candidatus Parabeggiatoa sp. HSG14 TaxID=3055593 RepID=UPI0025A7D8AE|nr:Calx-beta domain-containing protein [Thiotrichales bacterium HSG14]